MDTLHTRVTVEIFGEQYVVKGEGREERIRRVAADVDRRMREIARNHPLLDRSRTAVLTALNLADELARLQEQHERVLQMLEKEWEARHG